MLGELESVHGPLRKQFPLNPNRSPKHQYKPRLITIIEKILNSQKVSMQSMPKKLEIFLVIVHCFFLMGSSFLDVRHSYSHCAVSRRESLTPTVRQSRARTFTTEKKPNSFYKHSSIKTPITDHL